MNKKTKLGVAVASVVLMASIGVPAASAADIAPAKPRMIDAGSSPASGGYRFLVKYRAGATELRDTATVNRELAAAVSRTALAGSSGGSTGKLATREAVSATLLRRMASPGWNVVTTSRRLDGREALDFMRELAANPAVESVEIDQMYQRLQTATPAFVPNDPNYAQYQWNFSNATGGVRAPEAWEQSTGQGVVVAVLDTGIVQNHLDLAANVIPGYDMISDKRVSRRATDGRVAGGWDLGDWIEKDYCVALGGGPHPADTSSWHGSHVSGTIAQETNNGKALAGLAYNAKVMPVRVLGSCGGYGSDISDGIIWAAGGTVPGLPVNQNPAEVINMSLGSQGPASCPAIYQAAIDQANSLGTIVVVAAGNDNGNAGSYTMSSCNGVISVGATGITGAKAYYSNWGARVDLSAPGGGGAADGNPNGYIWQVINKGTQSPTAEWVLGGMGGTSMASPHVAAAVAMVQSVVGTPLTWTQMRDLLKQTARPFPIAIPANTPMGAGILNINAALTKATEVPCDPAVDQCGPVAIPLTNKVEVSGLAGAAGSEALYSFEAKAGAVLTFMTYGGSGDVSLYVGVGSEPTSSSFAAKSTRAGNSETVRFTAPAAGTYFVKLVGAASYSGVTLVARQ
ncbi:S8 family peptidase [Stenotrophomonas sp. YIM B06876]|uniref:S8 family peptidase n=1 Tax=Stenotrophomonas sp. YIM B06876 TaxID=3060211 RepID=UPI00273A527D|nr:S8 family peptidase [Stenotrophomonas sp. YIM B06876]